MEPGYRRGISRRSRTYNAVWLLLTPGYIYTLYAFLCPVWFNSLCRRSICACIDAIWSSRSNGAFVLGKHDDFSVLRFAVRNPSRTDVGAADSKPDTVQWLISAGIRAFEPNDRN